MTEQWEFETRAIHGDGKREKGLPDEVGSLPLYMSASFSYDSAESISDVFAGKQYGHIYSRISNPTVNELERRITALESGLGSVVVASGLAAISGVAYTLCEPGDEIIVSKSLFGGTQDLFSETLDKLGIIAKTVSPTNLEEIRAAISDKTRFFFFETIGNPRCDVPLIQEIVDLGKSHNIPVVMDSTLTSPAAFLAKKWGVAIVVHSLTKYVCGSGIVIGGSVTDLANFNWRESRSKEVLEASKDFGPFAFLAKIRRHILHNIGATFSPMNAFLTSVGIETLSLRVRQHSENALALANFLENHPKVSAVNYLGLSSSENHERAKTYFKEGHFGGLLTFSLESKESAYKVINELKLVKNMANLGDAKTLVIHPESTIFLKRPEEDTLAAGVTPEMIRVSVGIESIKDIIADFDQALSVL